MLSDTDIFEEYHLYQRKNIKLSTNELVQKQDVKDFVKILKLMELEEPSMLRLPLVCVMAPVESFSREDVKMVCPNHQYSHFVSIAFLLLEEVEGAFGKADSQVNRCRA